MLFIQELDYAVFYVDRERMKSLKIEPIVADFSYYPGISNLLHIIMTREGHTYCTTTYHVKNIDYPFIEHNLDLNSDLGVSVAGSPVIAVVDDKCVLIALHNNIRDPFNGLSLKSVTIFQILGHLKTGKCKYCQRKFIFLLCFTNNTFGHAVFWSASDARGQRTLLQSLYKLMLLSI